jgi:amidase
MRSLLLSLALPLAGCAATTSGAELNAPAPLPANASSEARTRAALARIEALNPRLGAVIATDPTALAQARRIDAGNRSATLLQGMPILIKDNIETAGPLPTTAGSLALANNVTGRDAPLVARLRQAGGVIVGKANLSEWANIRDDDSISGWSAVGGQTRNPHALNRNACGSSTGSAVAVAAGMVPAAIGTETDGSITCPAAMSGIVGFKPTVGLVSRTHVIPISVSQDTPGPMARNVFDAARVLEAMTGSDPADPATAEADRRRVPYSQLLSAQSLRGKRIGVMRFAAGFGTDELFEEALAVLRAQGAELVEIKEYGGDRGAIGRDEFTVLLHEFKSGLNDYLATTPPSVTTRTLADVIEFNRRNADREMTLFDQDIFEQAQATDGTASEKYRRARETSLRLAGQEGIDRLLKQHNVAAMVGPTRGAAWLIDVVHGDTSTGAGAGSLAAVAGYPHLTVPMGAIRGLPVGLSFMGPKWSDAMILSLGYAYEQASQKRVEPRLLPSIEQAPEIAPYLNRPQPRR